MADWRLGNDFERVGTEARWDDAPDDCVGDDRPSRDELRQEDREIEHAEHVRQGRARRRGGWALAGTAPEYGS